MVSIIGASSLSRLKGPSFIVQAADQEATAGLVMFGNKYICKQFSFVWRYTSNSENAPLSVHRKHKPFPRFPEIKIFWVAIDEVDMGFRQDDVQHTISWSDSPLPTRSELAAAKM